MPGCLGELTGCLLSHLKCFRKLSPAWEAEERLGLEQRESCSAASGLCLASSFTRAPRRPHSEAGRVFEVDYTGHKSENVPFRSPGETR